MTETPHAPTEIPRDARSLAMLTHLSGLAGYLVPFGGVLVPIVIWVVKKDDRVIAAIAKQAVLLNVAVFFGVILFGVIALTIILLPLSILGWIALGVVALVLPIVGAVKASDGQYYAYPLIGSRP